MVLPDVNVLVYAFRGDAPGHSRLRLWLESTINSDRPYGVFDPVLRGFLRVVTHPKADRLRSEPAWIGRPPPQRSDLRSLVNLKQSTEARSRACNPT